MSFEGGYNGVLVAKNAKRGLQLFHRFRPKLLTEKARGPVERHPACSISRSYATTLSARIREAHYSHGRLHRNKISEALSPTPFGA